MVKVEKNRIFSLNKILKSIWDEFVYGGHFLALGDAVALYVMAIILSIPVTWDFLVVIYLCVFAANLFNRSDESGHDALTNPVRVKVMKKYTKYFYPIVIVCLVSSIAIILNFSNVNALIFAVLIFLIAIMYTTIFKKMTKYIVGFKSYVAALFYALMVFLLVIYYAAPINSAVILVFIFYYLRIFISNAACDVKDIKSDKKRGLKTIAISLGEDGAMKFLNVLNILSGLIIVWGVYKNVLPLFSLALLATIPYSSYYFYLNAKINSKEFFTNAVVDGEFLLWLPYILVGKVFLS
ncbi:MAG: UbiA family prenyltransferase [Candidatus Saccharibacteria bacterium]